MENKPNYYAIIPAEVRYDKRLKANAKLLYGDILSIININRECFLTNAELAEGLNVSKSTISKWLDSLRKYCYIEIEMLLENKQIIGRKITVKDIGAVIWERHQLFQ